MIELQLDALDIDDAPKETFVAIRIGDTQKLSRLTSTRGYKFQEAAVGDRKFGKVEVFRRVGSTSIGIRNSSGTAATQEVSVDTNDAKPMNFRVQLGAKPEAQERRRQAAEKLSASPDNPKVQEAKLYLLEHNLEERLSEAMQAVLRDKPEDPAEFIAALLKKSSRDYKTLNGGRPVTSPAQVSAAKLGVPGVEFNKLPSVGPMMRSPRAVASTPAQLAQQQESMNGTTPQVTALQLETRDTILKASLEGTLESKLQDALASAQVVKYGALCRAKPSVGTWLMMRLPRGPGEEQKRPVAMVPTSTIYGSEFASSGLRPGFAVI